MSAPGFLRPRYRRFWAGVCQAIADHYGFDVSNVRVGAVVLGVFGPGLLVYVVLWIVFPLQPWAEADAERAAQRPDGIR